MLINRKSITWMIFFAVWLIYFPLNLQAQDTRQLELDLTTEEKIWLTKHTEIRVGIMDGWAPVSFQDSTGRPTGISVDFVTALNRRLGGILQLVPGKWEDMLLAVREKRLDAVLDITPNEQRRAHYLFTQPYLTIPHVIIGQQGRTDLGSEEALRGLTLALEKGFGNVRDFREKQPETIIREYRDTAAALDAVARGEADAYVGNRAVAIYIITRELIGNLVPHGLFYESSSILTIGVRNDWPDLVHILDKALSYYIYCSYFYSVKPWILDFYKNNGEKEYCSSVRV